MDFLEVIEQARKALRSKGRMTYRTLKRRYTLDDDALEDLKEELLYSTPQVVENAYEGFTLSENDSRWTPAR